MPTYATTKSRLQQVHFQMYVRWQSSLVTSSNITYIETLCFSPDLIIFEPAEAW
jgi:hypothetical protein